MTQRKWQTLDGWEVLCGWDRPLQHFFVSIDRTCTKCAGDGGNCTNVLTGDFEECEACKGSGTEYLFNNLDDKTGMTDIMGGMSIDQVRMVLERYLTKYQEGIIGALILDQAGNVGNLIVEMEPYGLGIQP